jgi:ferredoxin
LKRGQNQSPLNGGADMTVRVNPRLIDELSIYGAQDVVNCYHCGNCSALCPFSKEPHLLPRRSMRYLQMGLEERLRGDVEPWLCYYCGECSDECPRDAQPGETMMSMRRWLTSQYDFTGLAKLFYRSWKAELWAVIIVAILAGVGFTILGLASGDINVYSGPGAFLPASVVHNIDLALWVALASLLFINGLRMWWYTIGKRSIFRVSIFKYLKAIYMLPVHFFTQKRYWECEKKFPWTVHILIMLSWITMEILIVFFLDRFQAGPEIWLPAHIFGYLATFGLIGGALYALIGRMRRKETHYKYSQATDWIFLILIVFVASTGIIQHAVHRTGFEAAANIMYVVHMMGVVPLLIIQIPFGKLAHMIYRPLAMYFAALQKETLLAREKPAFGTIPQAKSA